MPLTEASFLTTNAGQQAQAMFAPATAVLSSALNNAVESGRRMVDLQSHQEDIFLSEREKLRLAQERKGLEARRMFESDRGFNEDVFKDRRNFAEDMFRDTRNFGLKSEIERGQLNLAERGLALQGELGRGQLANQKAENEGRAAYYKSQQELTSLKVQEAKQDLGGDTYLGRRLDVLASSPTMQQTMDERWARNVLGVGTDVYRSGASMEDLTSLDMYDQDVQQIQDLVKSHSREEVQAAWPKLNEKQRAIASQLLFKKEGVAKAWNSGKQESNILLPSGSLAPSGKAAGGGSFMSTFNNTGGQKSSPYSPVNPQGYLTNQPALSVRREDSRDFMGVGVLPPRADAYPGGQISLGF